MLEQMRCFRADTWDIYNDVDREMKYVLIRDNQPLAESGMESSFRSVRHYYDNDPVEMITALDKIQDIVRRITW